tara:strand:- start:811 stop:1008 length:198 start_codon:yes stop_codon:yes gene_type:complete
MRNYEVSICLDSGEVTGNWFATANSAEDAVCEALQAVYTPHGEAGYALVRPGGADVLLKIEFMRL